jgi:uncharacterized protein YPO0396
MVINNWGGISHRVMEFHEYVNLFSGKSGSGKSTVMDAIQVVLYGSTSPSFLNKAADDAKNRRSVLSYLRGAQKDGSSNRAGQDFYSTLVLELLDTGTHTYTCFGAVFEVGKTDADINGKYAFFSHSGKIPEDEYLSEDRIPYSKARIRKLCEARSKSADNRGRMDINRIHPSQEAYQKALSEVILGGVDAKRLTTMEKSAIALRMTNGTGQFIRDYMFPRSQESTIEKISDQLGAYREIKERVEDLEHRIELLDEIRENHEQLQLTRADMVRIESILKYIEIENNKAHLKAREQDLEQITGHLEKLHKELQDLETENDSNTAELVEVEAGLQASDYGQKERELKEIQNTITLLSGNNKQWRQILHGLSMWEEDEIVTGYVSNFALQLIEDFRKGNVSEEKCLELKKRLSEAMEAIDDEIQELNASRKKIAAELEEKKGIVEDLKNNRKPYSPELKKARDRLEKALRLRYDGASVHVFADLFDITDEEWKNAIEGRLGRVKYSLITAPEYALTAAELFKKMDHCEDITLINTAAILRDEPEAKKNSLYDAVKAEEKYVQLCLKNYLGRVIKCYTVEELHQVKDGVTPDCYSYSGYMFRHLKKADYTLRACIGTTVSKAKLKELEEDVQKLEKELLEDVDTCNHLKEASGFERLNQEPEHLVNLSQAKEHLESYHQKQSQLEQEMKELQDGTLVAELRRRQKELNLRLEELKTLRTKTQEQQLLRTKDQGNAESDVAKYRENLERLLEGFVINPQLLNEVQQNLQNQSEGSYRNLKMRELSKLQNLEEQQQEGREKARLRFNREYPSYGFSGVEKENEVYDQVLERCRKDFEPKYKEEFQKQCDQVYHTLRENVIAIIHGEIKEAYRHAREINRMLSRIKFSDSTYQIEILPATNENGQFYEMLMARELDSKVTDNLGFDGQMSLMEDEFYQKYEQKIQLLTEKFMPPRDTDAQKLTLRRQEMERYADYRSYLTFSMYEQAMQEDGTVKKNPVDEMAGRDSGGEGQNPKYVALLAGFAMLYMQPTNRDSKVRLVLLDEAFSKMDKERSEVCLQYARELELQLIVCVPDERLKSLIRNVDSVYGFRRHQNQITMMHIDKGNYLEMLEGKHGNEEDRDTDAGAVADREN